MNRWVIPLAEAPEDPAAVGGKAANLGALLRAGVRVPAGFCLTIDAYHEFVRHNDLTPLIQEAVRGRDLKDANAAHEAGQAILRGFLSAALPEEIVGALREARAGLDTPGVAVRSSAIDEDQAGATFAGQHETYLNVVGEHALEEAVRSCWASLYSPRALSYRATQGDGGSGHPSSPLAGRPGAGAGDKHVLSPVEGPPRYQPAAGARKGGEEPALAVIVQAMVDAEAAGVAFTADPVTGDTHQVHISSTYGLGEALVSGLVNPDVFVLLGPELEQLESQAGRKAMAVRLNPEGGTTEQIIPEEERTGPSIMPGTAREIALTARGLALHFGAPQDVEWAWAKDAPLSHSPPQGGRGSSMRLYVLQSRPMVFPHRSEPPWESPVPGARWYRNWRLGEWLSAPVTPLFATSLLPALVEGREATTRHRLDWGFPFAFSMLKPWHCIVNGYYFTRDDRDEASRQFGSDAADRLARARAMVEALKEWRSRHRPNYLRRLRRLQRFNLEQASGRAILEHLDGLYTDAAEWWHLISTIGFGSEERGARRLYEDTFGDSPKPEFITFFTGYDNAALRAQRELYAIAQEVRGQPELLTSLDAYRATHGHQVFTLDFAHPPIGETPEVLIATIQAYIQHGAPPPAQALPAQRRRRGAAMRRLRGLRPSRPELLEEFTLQFEFRQLSAAIRENTIYDFQRLWPVMRRAILELGRRLTSAGSLDAPEDVFFVTNDELTDALGGLGSRRRGALHAPAEGPGRGGGQAPDLRTRVRTRREEHARNARLSPPDHIGGPNAASPSVRAMERTGTIVEEAGQRMLIGQPASPGRATGPARIIRDTSEFAKLRKGDILVCVAASPAWTVLFPLAAGLVTEVGGAATHSSLVAREYALPAVVATGIATQVLHDGQIITIDGSKGTVDLSQRPL